ncbi:hypothetical protein INT45_000803 [Circinella minor]|uniref:Uncharacterized protein n=1 Tax=Circinella minor TaxID=1195481 RepID=A0A8H7VH16_9FUNG|nr:hypothetical protein INT45_000803 [Circinella minor]
MLSSSSQGSIQDVDFSQLRYGLSTLDNASHQSTSSNSTNSTSSLEKQSARSSISSHLKKKSKSLLDGLKNQNSPSATTSYQAKADYLLLRK